MMILKNPHKVMKTTRWHRRLHVDNSLGTDTTLRTCAQLRIVPGETPGAPIWKTDNMTNGNCRMVILSQSLKIVLQPCAVPAIADSIFSPDIYITTMFVWFPLQNGQPPIFTVPSVHLGRS